MCLHNGFGGKPADQLRANDGPLKRLVSTTDVMCREVKSSLNHTVRLNSMMLLRVVET